MRRAPLRWLLPAGLLLVLAAALWLAGSAWLLRQLLPAQDLQGHLLTELRAASLQAGAEASGDASASPPAWRVEGLRWQWQGLRQGSVVGSLQVRRLVLHSAAGGPPPTEAELLRLLQRPWPARHRRLGTSGSSCGEQNMRSRLRLSSSQSASDPSQRGWSAPWGTDPSVIRRAPEPSAAMSHSVGNSPVRARQKRIQRPSGDSAARQSQTPGPGCVRRSTAPVPTSIRTISVPPRADSGKKSRLK